VRTDVTRDQRLAVARPDEVGRGRVGVDDMAAVVDEQVAGGVCLERLAPARVDPVEHPVSVDHHHVDGHRRADSRWGDVEPRPARRIDLDRAEREHDNGDERGDPEDNPDESWHLSANDCPQDHSRHHERHADRPQDVHAEQRGDLLFDRDVAAARVDEEGVDKHPVRRPHRQRDRHHRNRE